MISFAEKAAHVDEILFSTNDNFHLDKISLFSICETDRMNDEGEIVGTLVLASTDDDMWTLMNKSDTVNIVRASDYIAIVMTGWAAPNLDTKPSQSFERKRVRILQFASSEGQVSVMRFEDDPTEQHCDISATGNFADEISKLMKRAGK
jgi:hypothetical protein